MGTYEGGDAYDCEMRKGNFPIWELDLNAMRAKVPIWHFGALGNESAIKQHGGIIMYEKRGLSKAQFAQSGYDTSDYNFIETEGIFEATLDLKVWGNRMLKSFLTLEDGRKIIACTFHRENYLGMADIPLGSALELTLKKPPKAAKSTSEK